MAHDGIKSSTTLGACQRISERQKHRATYIPSAEMFWPNGPWPKHSCNSRTGETHIAQANK